MSTNYGSGDGPDSKNRTTAGSGDVPTERSGNSNPTEPIRNESPKEPAGNDNPTEPIGGGYPTTPIGTGSPASSPGPADNFEMTGGAAAAATAAGSRTWDDSGDTPKPRTRARVGTIVWGLILTAVAIILILAEVASINLDTSQIVIGLLIGSGLVLVIGGVISAGNREKDDKWQ